jgi:hypothetical protein
LDAIKYVSALVLALIVIAIAVGVIYTISGSFGTETNQSGQQNADLLNCVQKADKTYEECKQLHGTSFEDENHFQRERIST